MKSLPVLRPTTRGECVDGPRPCTWVKCRHYLGAPSTESCSLDEADRRPHTLAEIALLLGVSRERIRQLETEALAALKESLPARLMLDESELAEGWSEGETPDADSRLWFDAEFKQAVHKAYERIVPEAERGSKVLQRAIFGRGAS